jgi:hypothetical protein
MCALVLGACKVDAQVDVTLREDGTGIVRATITLDKDAVTRVTGRGRTLAQAVRLDDLRQSGWDVSGWRDAGNGGSLVTFAHGYTGERELAQRLRDLSGRAGPLKGVHMTRTRTFLRSQDSVSLVADLRDVTSGIREDAELVASLKAAGLDVDALDAQLQSELRDALRLRVVLHAPGGRRVIRDLRVGQRATITASRSKTDNTRALWLGGAGLLGVLALGLLLAASVSARHERGRRARRGTPPTT